MTSRFPLTGPHKPVGQFPQFILEFLDSCCNYHYHSPMETSLSKLARNPDVVLHSAYKLAKRSKEGAWEDNEDGTYLRFLFFLGLLVAGLKIPVLSSRRGFSR